MKHIILNIYYSNFGKDQDFHRAQCTGPTHLAFDDFCFTSSSKKFSVVIENAMGYGFSCKFFFRRSHGCQWVRKCKMLHFLKFHPKIQVHLFDLILYIPVNSLSYVGVGLPG